METQYLKTLCAVIELSSFSRAADELCITQSAVSQRIKLLEDRYGHALIERIGTQIHPTAAGKLVQAKAEQILILERGLEFELKGLGTKSKLSICCTPTFGIVYLPKVLNRYFLANSQVDDFKFTLNTPDQILNGLVANEFGMAVIEHCGELDFKDATLTRLPPDELVFISSPALDLSGPTIELRELLVHRLIARREGCSSRKLLLENLRNFGKGIDDFNGTIIYDDLHLNIQTVLAGRGVAFVSRSLVNDLINKKELRGHSVQGFNCRRSRTVAINRNRQHDPEISKFLECIKAVDYENSPN